MLKRISQWIFKQLESSLLPVRGPLSKRVAVYFLQALRFCLFFPLAIVFSLVLFLAIRLFPQQDSPLVAFAKRPNWKTGEASIPKCNSIPIKMGFSTADIQDSGPHSPQFVGTNWGNFYQKNKEAIGSFDCLPDRLSNPEQLVHELREMGVTSWRSSINLMPKKGNQVDRVFVAKYCDYFKALIDAGIEVMVTLNHFVHPDDFDWADPDSARRLGEFAEAVADDLYNVGVRKILVSNEQTVFALQSQIMGKFPPFGKMQIEKAARVMHNMMRAQVICYSKLKAKHPDFQVGLTHDPIRYRHYHKMNLLWTPGEKILCHYLTEISHGALYRFFLTGEFSLPVPFFSNYSFSIPEFGNPTTRPMDFIGLQYYTDPLIRFPQGSVTRVPGEKLTSYKYRPYPQGMASVLEEMAALQIPIEITETGIDICINEEEGDQERILFFDRLFQSVQKAIDHGVDVRSLHLWTKDKSWEWAEGFNVDFSLYNEKGPRGAAVWLKNLLTESAGKLRV